ncbi:MAG: protein kinase, partial [Pseudomonadota bacterium]
MRPFSKREVLGQGATSTVWRGESAGISCVLKLGRGPAEAPRFADEAERLLFAAAPEFPQLLGVGFAGALLCAELGVKFESGTPYLLLSAAPGVSLDHLLGAVQQPGSREALAHTVARDIGAALSALHASGAAHGDVKPSNIVVGEGRARLVDFGLSGAASAPLTGGTRRYLAPEVFADAAGDARARDLWALGATLLEILAPEAAVALGALSEREFHGESPLFPVVRALLARAPGARPSAAWVFRRAQASAPESAALEAAERRRASVRRAYLSTRQGEIFRAARHKSLSLGLRGHAAAWLAETFSLADGILKLRGLAPHTGVVPTLLELDASARARFLVALVGPVAASWPALRELSEELLLSRLLGLAEHGEPESFTLAELERGALSELDVTQASAVDVALALRSQLPDPRWLDRGESLVRRDGGPLALALALGRAFRLRGELGRALAFLGEFPDIEARVASAELCRRARDHEAANEILDGLFEQALSVEQREQGAAIRARIAIDAGELKRASTLLEPYHNGVHSLETRALLEIALGRRSAALEAAELARLHAAGDEERARAEGVLGLLAHASGEAEPALRAFRAASDLAARSGALLEEATYLTGLSAAATNLGELGEALFAARRALLLFEALGRTADAARALL